MTIQYSTAQTNSRVFLVLLSVQQRVLRAGTQVVVEIGMRAEMLAEEVLGGAWGAFSAQRQLLAVAAWRRSFVDLMSSAPLLSKLVEGLCEVALALL